MFTFTGNVAILIEERIIRCSIFTLLSETIIFPSLFYRKIALDVKLFFVYLFIVYLPSSFVFLVLFGIFSCLFYKQIHLCGTHKTIDILLGARDESVKQPLSDTIKVKTLESRII
jgi:hypothetical protein